MSYFCIVIIDILHSSFYLVTMLNAQPIIHGCYAASYYSIKEVLNTKKITVKYFYRIYDNFFLNNSFNVYVIRFRIGLPFELYKCINQSGPCTKSMEISESISERVNKFMIQSLIQLQPICSYVKGNMYVGITLCIKMH